MLEIESLGFSYGSKKVLEDIEFKLDNGYFVSILGPNGVGKTTLLRCLCNIHRPQEGRILLDGEDILSIHPREMSKKVAYVPQKGEVVHTTVFDHVMIGRRPHMTWDSGKRDVDKAWEVIEKLGLEEISDSYIDEISGGQLQKVNIARALAQEPRLLVLDEPSNNLDLSNQHRILQLIGDLTKETGMAAVMTMHDINLALYYSDKIIMMYDGRIVADGGIDVVNPETVKLVYGIESDVMDYKGQRVLIPLKGQ
ncbi:MAG: ABC transporter ATP-binding protein [Candidatus Methanomethylophilaceae archaeon]